VVPNPTTSDDLTRADEVATVLARSTGTWSNLFRADAFQGLALAVATAAPTLDTCELVTLAKLGAWICAIDDVIDDAAIDDAALTERIEQYEMLARYLHCAELAFDPIARMFCDVRDELQRAPLAARLWPLFSKQLSQSLRAMHWARSAARAKRAGADVSVDDYLIHAADSICVGVAATAAAMFLGEDALLAHLPCFLGAQRHASILVRIANDRATWAREQSEGAANILLFLERRDEAPLTARVRAEQRWLASVLGQLRAVAPDTAAFVANFTDFFLTMYRHGDLSDVRRAP
jgi:hypothetical protein